ncbi:MAG: hypothetical protein Tsb002_34760 [Wenzhouxiangellaceae bacterium]
MIKKPFKPIPILAFTLLISAFLASSPAHSAPVSIDHLVCEEGTAFVGFLLCKAVISGGSGAQNLDTEWRVQSGDAMLDDSPFPDIVTGFCQPRNVPLNIVQVRLTVRDTQQGLIDSRLSNLVLCADPDQGEIKSTDKQ